MRDSRYEALLERVRSIDESAYVWIVEEGERLDSFKESYLLRNCFSWRDTPQGYAYWREIALALNER